MNPRGAETIPFGKAGRTFQWCVLSLSRRIARALKPGGLFLCQFCRCANPRPPGRSRFVRRVVAACTLGNLSYEAGDILWQNVEFVHEFMSEDAIRSELEEGGISVVSIRTDRTPIRGGAVGRKSPEMGRDDTR